MKGGMWVPEASCPDAQAFPLRSLPSQESSPRQGVTKSTPFPEFSGKISDTGGENRASNENCPH